MDVDSAGIHVGADPMHAGEMAFEFQVLVRRIARDGKHLGKRNRRLPWKISNFSMSGQRFVARPIGSQPLDLHGNGRFAAVNEV